MQSPDRQRIKRLLLVQLIIALLAAFIAWFVDGEAALSAGLGGLASLVPNALFAWWIFAPYRAQEAGKLLTRFYVAELLKLLLTVLIFIAVFVWVKPINVAALFVAYFLVQVLSPLVAHKFTS